MLCASCSFFSGNAVFPVSDLDRRSVADRVAALNTRVPYIQATAQSPHVRVYKVAFDGTLNDRQRVPKAEQYTIVAHIAKLIDEGGDVDYRRGPGMQGKSIDWSDAMFGTTSIGVAQQAKARYDAVAQRWRAADPDVEIRIFVTGFSRGAATARHFMNLVAADDARLHGAAPGRHAATLYALLFDTVSTGQTDKMQLALPAALDYLVHFVALDEARPLFKPLIDVTPAAKGGKPILGVQSAFLPNRINLVSMPGAHSDVGASYVDGIGNAYVVFTEQLLYLMGLHKKNCWEVQDDYFVAGKHDSRGLIDRALRVPAPNAADYPVRHYIPMPVPDLSPDEFLSQMRRLDVLETASPSKLAGMQTHRKEKQGLTLMLTRSQAGLQVKEVKEVKEVQGAMPPIDPASLVYALENGMRTLKFRRAGMPATTTLFFDDTLWSHLPADKEAVFNITRLERDGKVFLATFVDNELVRVVPATPGETLVLSSTPEEPQCTPDGHPVHPLQVMVLSPAGAPE